jgi:hypothetical protein
MGPAGFRCPTPLYLRLYKRDIKLSVTLPGNFINVLPFGFYVAGDADAVGAAAGAADEAVAAMRAEEAGGGSDGRGRKKRGVLLDSVQITARNQVTLSVVKVLVKAGWEIGDQILIIYDSGTGDIILRRVVINDSTNTA